MSRRSSPHRGQISRRSSMNTERKMRIDPTTYAPKFGQLQQEGPNKEDEEPHDEDDRSAWAKIRRTYREPLAEFLGTCIMIVFGVGSVAQVVLTHGEAGIYQSINWGWGIGVCFGVYVSGGISGGHLNPAVTMAMCVFRKFTWRKFPVYMAAQILGCMTGAAIIYGTYRSAIDTFEGGVGIRTVGLPTSTAGLFCTYPKSWLSKSGQFLSEAVATAVLIICVFAIGDENNNAAGSQGPVVLFFLVFGSFSLLY